jgi:hypothetical protein
MFVMNKIIRLYFRFVIPYIFMLHIFYKVRNISYNISGFVKLFYISHTMIKSHKTAAAAINLFHKVILSLCFFISSC